MPSAPRALTERITGVGGGSIRENVSSQPAGFFASSSRSSRPQEGDHVVAAGDGLHLVHPLQGDLRRHAEDGGDGGRGGGVRLVGAARAAGGGSARPSRAGRGRGRRDSAQLGVGRRKPHSPQNQSSPGRCITPPQDGQDQASSFHSWPAATHTTLGEEEAAQTTSGSSALAMTTAFGAGQALAPLLGEHPGLGGAVELVAGEVEQRDRLGRRRRGRRRRGTSRRPRSRRTWRPSRRPAPR